MTSSALHEAHQEIVERLREIDERLRKDVELALAQCERQLVPVGIPVQLQDALRQCDLREREVDRLEGVGRDWEDECDRLAGMLQEANR